MASTTRLHIDRASISRTLLSALGVSLLVCGCVARHIVAPASLPAGTSVLAEWAIPTQVEITRSYGAEQSTTEWISTTRLEGRVIRIRADTVWLDLFATNLGQGDGAAAVARIEPGPQVTLSRARLNPAFFVGVGMLVGMVAIFAASFSYEM